MSSDRPFFKIWAAKALLSGDLAELSDHERSIWLYLMCVASLEEPRWRTPVNAHLARQCYTNPKRLAAALKHMADLGMVRMEDGYVFMLNAAALNEDTEKRKPSDDPERIRERVTRHRNAPRNAGGNAHDVTPVTRYSNAHKEKEKEEEKEEEEEKEPEGAHTPDLPVGVRERQEMLLSRVPTRMRWDVDIIADHTQLAEDCTDASLLAQAIADASRNGDFMSARNIRKYLPPGCGGIAVPDEEVDDFEARRRKYIGGGLGLTRTGGTA